MVQVVIYSVATGRVRRVIDPQKSVPNVQAFLASAGAGPGEAALAYTKQGGGADTLSAWQAAVDNRPGNALGIVVSDTDWYCGVDASNAIKWWGVCDPLCHDAIPGLTLVNAPWGADSRWTYNGVSFIAPAASPVVAKIV